MVVRHGDRVITYIPWKKRRWADKKSTIRAKARENLINAGIEPIDSKEMRPKKARLSSDELADYRLFPYPRLKDEN
jgi:hypothetical protein